jgi:thymidylate synthase
MQEEYQYLELVKRILETGEERHGRNGFTKSLFAERLEFHLNDGKTFPLLTTKRVFWRGVVEELLWFLRGSSNVKELQEKKIHIWDGNSTRQYLDSVNLKNVAEGDIGHGYGKVWRYWSPNPDERFDQLEYIINELRNNPKGRRCLLSAWNPPCLSLAALPPCHYMYEFYLNNNGLSCQMHQRSADTICGTPFNIASTACFTMILAHVLRVKADRIIIVMGDTHVYSSHIDNALIQVDRKPKDPPELKITREPPPLDASTKEIISWIESLTFEDFNLTNYNYHSPLKFEMVV